MLYFLALKVSSASAAWYSVWDINGYPNVTKRSALPKTKLSHGKHHPDGPPFRTLNNPFKACYQARLTDSEASRPKPLHFVLDTLSTQLSQGIWIIYCTLINCKLPKEGEQLAHKANCTLILVTQYITNCMKPVKVLAPANFGIFEQTRKMFTICAFGRI